MDLLLDLVTVTLGVGTFSAFAAATRYHFHSPKMELGAWLVALANIAGSVLLTILAWWDEPPLMARLIGWLVMAKSLALFLWAIAASRTARLRFVYDPEKPHSLVQTGPYRYVRHPFYTSYMLLFIGWAIADWQWLGVVVPVVIVALYFFAARMEERNFAASPLADSYADYHRRVGGFVPRSLKPYNGPQS